MKRNIYCCYAPVKSHQRSYYPPIFNILFLIFNSFFLINFSTYCYTFSNFSPLFYLFFSQLLSTLISHFLYPFIFLNFLLFLFPSSYYKFTILFSILFIVFLHKKKKKKSYFSISFFFFLIFVFRSYYKFTIIYSILFIVFLYTKFYFSLFFSLSFSTHKRLFLFLSLSHFFFHFWWIF